LIPVARASYKLLRPAVSTLPGFHPGTARYPIYE